MANNRNSRADTLCQEAQALEKKFSLFSKATNEINAADMYIKAANLYKASEEWDKAAEAFSNAHRLYTKNDERSEANKAKTNMALCKTKGSNPESGIEEYLLVVEKYIENGQFSQAAKTQAEVAKIYESLKNYEKASEAYLQAAEYYINDNRPASALPLRISAAKLNALTGKYMEACEVFTTIGDECLQGGSLRFGAKDHFINAIICRIAAEDDIGALKALTLFRKNDPSVSSERDYKIMEEIIDSVKENDLEKFEEWTGKYAQIKQVDEFRKVMFDSIKQKMEENENAEVL